MTQQELEKWQYAQNEWSKEVTKKKIEIFDEIRLRFDCTGHDLYDIENLITELLLVHKCAVACDSILISAASNEVSEITKAKEVQDE